MRANFRQLDSWFIDPRIERDLHELNTQHAAWGADVRPNALMLTCRHKIIDRIVECVSAQDGTLVLRRSCEDNLGGRSPQRWPAEVIAYAIQMLRVSEIIICGHSGCETIPAHRAPHEAPGSQSRTPIVQRVERHLQRIKNEQESVVDQLTRLQEMPPVRAAIAAGGLTLQAVFYIADSGAYLRYDEISRAFRPAAGTSPSTG